jgi:glycine cleavage system H protein
MSKTYAILPCNGIDKCAGRVAGELAIRLNEATGGEIICPVLFRLTDTRYKKLAGENPLLVIDGCTTRCASKLAAEKGLKIARKITVAAEAKKRDTDLGNSLRFGTVGLKLVDELLTAILQEDAKKEEGEEGHEERAVFPISFDYETYMKDKFIFRLPRSGFYFNENDCWAYIVGKVARVGLTDYAQKVLSDIMFFNPPAVGAEIEQFGELGSVESGKAVFEVISPVSGKITAVNEDLLAAPELINESPYEKGWVAELELTDIENDRELLLDFAGYFEIMKRKVDEYHV